MVGVCEQTALGSATAARSGLDGELRQAPQRLS
jgi:hypothetical protein